MKTSVRKSASKIAIALLSVGLLASTATAVSLIFTLNTPATLTVNDPGLALFASDCTTPLTTLAFPSVTPGGSTSVEACLVPGGSTSEYIDSNSLTTTLPSTIGTLSWTIIQKQGNNQLSPPIQLQPGNPGSVMLLNFTLTTTASATSQPFTVTISVYNA